MFHRFAVSEDRHSPGFFRRCLHYLRAHRFNLIELETLVRAGLEGRPIPRRAVAITFDDCYLDQFEIGLPLLAEYDVPATFFLTSGFADGELWMWWDQIEYLVQRADVPRLEIVAPSGPVQRYDLSTEAGRIGAINSLVEYCKEVPQTLMRTTIEAVAVACHCELPEVPPSEYRGMTWEDARIAERLGIRFGPATVSHPILSRVEDSRAEHEIAESWRRVREELSEPVPIFCFPNGKPPDFGPREIQLCARAGLLGAVSAQHHYFEPDTLRAQPEAAFAIPRFSAPESFPELVRIVSGLEVLLNAIRR